MPQNNQELLAWLADPSTPVSHNTRTQAAQTLAQQHNWPLLQRLLTDLTPTQRWAELRFAAEGSYTGYLADLDVLRDWAIAQNDLALNIHCTLIASSIVSLSSNIDGELLVQLLKVGTPQGKWSVEAALAHIEHQPEESIMKLKCLIEANIAIPWEHILTIVEQAQDHELLGQIILYQLVPQDLKETVVMRMWQMLPSIDALDDLMDFLQLITQLDSGWQSQFWSYLLQQDTLKHWPFEVYKHVPEHLRARVLQQIQAERDQNILYHKKYPNQLGLERDILTYFAFLPRDQQRFSYWGISFQALLISRWYDEVKQYLHEDERQLYTHYILSSDLLAIVQEHHPVPITMWDGISDVGAIVKNILEFYTHYAPHEQQLLDKALELLLHYPNHVSQTILDLLPSASYRLLAERFLQAEADIYNEIDTKVVFKLMPYMPELTSQLIDLVLKIIAQSPPQLRQYDYLCLLPYYPAEQQPALVEQVLLSSQKIDSFSEQILLQTELLNFLPTDQQPNQAQAVFLQIEQSIYQTNYRLIALWFRLAEKRPELHDQLFELINTPAYIQANCDILCLYYDQQRNQTLAQTIFEQRLPLQRQMWHKLYPYLTAQQHQQALELLAQTNEPQLANNILEGLISVPNYPLHQLLPHLHKVMNPLGILDQMVQQASEQDLPLIEQAITEHIHTSYSEYSRIIVNSSLSKQTQTLLANYFSADLETRFWGLLDLTLDLIPEQAAQLRQQVWAYLTTRQHFTIAAIVDDTSLFCYCVGVFNQQQIEQALQHLLTKSHSNTGESAIVPYLDHNQLQQLLQHIPSEQSYHKLALYRIAHDHHHILAQADYYQAFLDTLLSQKSTRELWQWFDLLDANALYLKTADYESLFHQSMQQRNAIPGARETIQMFEKLTKTLQHHQLIKLETMNHFIQYATYQSREHSFEVLKSILPAYLQTLAPDQQQQIAAQIYRSVEQISTAWP